MRPVTLGVGRDRRPSPPRRERPSTVSVIEKNRQKLSLAADRGSFKYVEQGYKRGNVVITVEHS